MALLFVYHTLSFLRASISLNAWSVHSRVASVPTCSHALAYAPPVIPFQGACVVRVVRVVCVMCIGLLFEKGVSLVMSLKVCCW